MYHVRYFAHQALIIQMKLNITKNYIILKNWFILLEVQAADIRLDPTYMLYYTISQIFHPTLTTGIAPMVALIFMNTSIFFGKLMFIRLSFLVFFFNFEGLPLFYLLFCDITFFAVDKEHFFYFISMLVTISSFMSVLIAKGLIV